MIMLDLNVLLDVLQKREPHYRASAAVLDQLIHGQEQGAISSHAVTTIHYLVNRHAGPKAAAQALNWLFKHLEICPVGRRELERAHALGWADFEDAVVAAVAEQAACTAIITRNIKDFKNSPVPALTPEERLLL